MEKRTCANCKFFINYYTKVGMRLISVNCGHCSEKIIRKYKPYVPDTNYCEKWEEVENKELPIKSILITMNKRIEELLLIFNDK